jgi:peptidylprolyl isomerase
VGFVDGFPAGRDPKTGKTWLAHCYGTLGAGRSNEADSSIGAELYVVARPVAATAGRQHHRSRPVIQGMELLSVIPRGPAPMGFYEKPELRTTIKAIKLVSEVPEAERTPSATAAYRQRGLRRGHRSAPQPPR